MNRGILVMHYGGVIRKYKSRRRKAFASCVLLFYLVNISNLLNVWKFSIKKKASSFFVLIFVLFVAIGSIFFWNI